MAASASEISYLFPVSISHWALDEEWVRTEADRVAGNTGCFVDSQGWRGTILWFDTAEKSQEMRRRLSARYKAMPMGGTRQRVNAQYAIIWGLSTGLMLDVVRAYRRSRYECSSHGVANHAAAEAIVARCRHMDHDGWGGIERARTLAEYMLIYYEARHRSWFWKDLEGKHELFPFSYHH